MASTIEKAVLLVFELVRIRCAHGQALPLASSRSPQRGHRFCAPHPGCEALFVTALTIACLAAVAAAAPADGRRSRSSCAHAESMCVRRSCSRRLLRRPSSISSPASSGAPGRARVSSSTERATVRRYGRCVVYVACCASRAGVLTREVRAVTRRRVRVS